MGPPRSRDDFRVAIVCALAREAAAVLDLFDECYDEDGSRYGKEDGDMNVYTTGCIGPYDIVLIHMPSMGVHSAARAASQVRMSFKKISLALVVGVCGGAPLTQPIILGDVVISNSVIEFYTGRHYSDGIQAKSGPVHTLGRPNPEIRALLNKLDIPRVRKRLEANLRRSLTELCKKSDTAQYPGVEHDKLFAASYRHMHRKETSQQQCLCLLSRSDNDPVCDEALNSSCEVLGCDVEATENPSRRMRLTSGVPAPSVHIGTIGATAVMKSGQHRDIIANENKIIAFEMEGAGVWEDLPCVIIKGVCDYADSHKNKKWQDYAAATAAAGAKAFLDHWGSKQHVGQGSSEKRSLSLGDQDDASTSRRVRRQPLSMTQSPTSDDTSSDLPVVQALASLGARKVLLEALNYEQLDARHATIKTAHAATCQWLLSQAEYLEWRNEQRLLEHHGFLWIKGKPGAGKSTIMKFAYTNAKKDDDGSITISYFFNARGEHLEKSTRGMYRSLLFQLLSELPKLQAVLDTTEATSLQNTSPDLWKVELLQSLFLRSIERLEDQQLICFVDALDECENNEDQVREIVSFFEELGECAVENKIRLLVCFSSRHYPHVTIEKGVELTLEAQQGHSEDITKYVNSKLKVGRNKRVEQIKIDVQKKSQGIFLWVVLVIPILQKAYDHGQVQALGKCLKDVPKDLNELFHDILSRDTQNMENLTFCLRWILYAERPLSPSELYFAMLSASETGSVAAWDPDNDTLEDIGRFILSSSKGLAEPTRGKTPTIQFIHESVRDFLLKENGSAVLQLGVDCTSAGPIHDSLKKQCQQYFFSVTSEYCLESPDMTAKMFPFLDYSIRYVFKHAELAAGYDTPQQDFLRDFPLEQWISLHDYIEKYKIRRYGTGTSLLYILTERNLMHLFRLEVSQSQSINAKGGRYDFPIVAAIVVGNNSMLGLLLEHGADPNKSGREYRHALLAAVDKSNTQVFELLISYNSMSSSNVLLTRGLFPALLGLAVKRKAMLIIKLLLQDREVLATADLLAPQHLKPLAEDAIDDGDDDIFQMLLDAGIIGPSLRDQFGYVLVMASKHGKEALVRMFVDKRGPYCAGDGTIFLSQALLKAVEHNHETIVRILLDSGADVNMSDDRQQTGLHIACHKGYEVIVRMLLDSGAGVNMSDDRQQTGLHIACHEGYEVIVRMLLDSGASVNMSDDSQQTGLHIACHEGYEAIVRNLLDNGADIEAVDETHATGLHSACRRGHEAIVLSLLDKGADIEAVHETDGTGLHIACSQGHDTTVRVLLENGANINTVDKNNRTGLVLACREKQEAVVRVLLDKGADINKASPLHINLGGARHSSEAITSILLEYGADPNQYSLAHNLPLHTALVNGMTGVVKLLLDRGADLNMSSYWYKDAFDALDRCYNSEDRAELRALLREKE